jgi:rhodanese-related sulfurtransferase
LDQLDKWISKIPFDQKVLLVDAYGDESAKAASLLSSKGYKNIYTAFNGLDAWLHLSEKERKSLDNLVERNIGYQLIDGESFNKIATAGNLTILDIRPENEFNNQSPEGWRNRGRIKGSINIPAQKLAMDYSSLNKSKAIVVTGLATDQNLMKQLLFSVKKGSAMYRYLHRGFGVCVTRHSILPTACISMIG